MRFSKFALILTLGFASSALASEEDIRAEIQRLKTIVAAQQAELIQIKTNMAQGPITGTTPVSGGGTNAPSVEDSKVLGWCSSVGREAAGCLACAKTHGFDTAPFKECVKTVPRL